MTPVLFLFTVAVRHHTLDLRIQAVLKYIYKMSDSESAKTSTDQEQPNFQRPKIPPRQMVGTLLYLIYFYSNTLHYTLLF